MYNRQLVTFLKVAETGSFSKAAEALYVSASAVIQQINNLEKDLDVTLFTRTRKGIQLTPAGEYLREEGRKYVEQGDLIRSRLLEMDARKPCIYVGTSMEEKCRLLYDLWILFSPGNLKYDVRMVVPASEQEMPRQAQLVESVRDGAPWQDGWEFLELCRVPLGCAVGKDHPLAGKAHFSTEDIRNHESLFINRNPAGENAPLLQEILQQGVSPIVRSGWSGSLIWECSLKKMMLLVPACWADVVVDLSVKPCDLPVEIPYGFFYRGNPQEPLQEFLDFVRSIYSGTDPRGIVPVF